MTKDRKAERQKDSKSDVQASNKYITTNKISIYNIHYTFIKLHTAITNICD